MKKTIIILAVGLITLSSTLAFRSKSEIAPVKKEEAAPSKNNGEGFALQDSDQWK